MAHPDDHAARRDKPSHLRLPTIDEALTYSPFTSIVPFDTAMLPPPFALLGTAHFNLLPGDRRQAASGAVQALDDEARNAERASQRLQKTLSSVKGLLSSQDLPRYKMKGLSDGPIEAGPSPAGAPSQDFRRHLGPFARKALAVSSKASQPSDGLPPAKSSAASLPKTVPQVSVVIERPATSTTAPVRTNATNSTNGHATSGPPHTVQSFVIEAPISSQEENAQFVPLQVSTHSDNDSRPAAAVNGTSNVDIVDEPLPKAQIAIGKLQALISDVFEAEIDAESGENQDNPYFSAVETTDGSATVLQAEPQLKLDKLLNTVSRYKSMPKLATDDLVRLQKLCANVISASVSRHIGIGEGWDDHDIDEWLQKLVMTDQALVAARSILRIMNSGIEDKQLFSEDTLSTMLDFIKQTVDTCTIPVVELRPGDADGPFKVAQRYKDYLTRIFGSTAKLFDCLGDVLSTVDLDETAVASIEALCTVLIFVETAPSEASSALGIQCFEKLRRAAMDALAKLFAHNLEQRQSIFDNILTSLERLPVGRQSARQYKLPDAKPIQLVSALLLRLVQTSAIGLHSNIPDLDSGLTNGQAGHNSGSEEDEVDPDYDSDESTAHLKKYKKPKRRLDTGTFGDLEGIVAPLYEKVTAHARYIANFLVSRALSSTKSSGEPYRNLLDIFVEDFLNVLGLPDWPAAEVILRQLLSRFWEITENAKSSAPSKAMALELMGTMLSGITDLRLHTAERFARTRAETTKTFDDLKALHLLVAADDATDADALGLKGPYCCIIEYLRNLPGADANAVAALNYHAVQWGFGRLAKKDREDATSSQLPEEDSESLCMLLRDVEHYQLEDSARVSTEEGQLASALIIMRLQFCRLFGQILNKLLTSMSSDQASLRSKSLRSIEDVLQKDASILDRGNFVLASIIKRMTDQSSQVRDAALGLLATCLQLRPALDTQAYEHVLRRTTDSAINVKKRSIKMSKDIYARNDSVTIRSMIADALIHSVSDIEQAVIDLARSTLEEIWMAPFYNAAESDSEDAQAKIKILKQVALIIETVGRSPDTVLVLQDILEDMMSAKSNNASSNIAVCKKIILLLVDAICDDSTLPTKAKLSDVIQTLSVFAMARAKLFGSAQIMPLLPYLKNLQNSDDLDIYRYAIIVLRCTLPHIKNLPRNVLIETQATLLANVSKLPQAELKEVVACLWALSGMSGNIDKLVAVTRSAMQNLKTRSSQSLQDPQTARQIERLLLLVAHFNNAFDLDTHVQAFKDVFTTSRASHVVAIATDIVCPLTSPKSPDNIRVVALESLLCMCHAWPKEYLRPDVVNALELAIHSGNPRLELVLMQAWKDFFVSGSDRRPVEGKEAAVNPTAIGDRIEKTYIATDRDGASTALAQRLMSDIIRIAMNSTGDLSVMSAQVVININRMGLVHPKESASALVALETSPNTAIAKSAFDEHSAMFSKHESIFEKETIRAIQQAFKYQKDTVGDSSGLMGSPPQAKLHLFWEVLKNASAKVRKKFLSNICTQLDFTPGKLDMAGAVPVHVQFTLFCVQNLALFDYSKGDDIQTLVDGVEKVFASTGTAVVHGIEALLLDNTIQGVSSANGERSHVNGGADIGDAWNDDSAGPHTIVMSSELDKAVDEKQLRELTAGAQVLTLMWEVRTYLRKIYSLAKPSAGTRGRPPKDPAKVKEARAPQRVPNATLITERFVTKTTEMLAAIKSEASQRSFCTSFQTLMTIDDEIKVRADGDGLDDSLVEDGDGFAGPGTPSGDEGSIGSFATPSKRGRKRKTSTPAYTPRKKRANSRGRASRGLDDDDDWE